MKLRHWYPRIHYYRSKNTRMFLYGNKKDALHRLKNMLHKVKGNQLISTNMIRAVFCSLVACFSQTSFLPFRELKKIEWVSLVLELSKRTSVFPPASVKWKQTRKTAKRDTKNPKGRHVSFACAMLEARGSYLPRYRFFLVLWPRRPGEMVIIIYEAPTVIFKVPIRTNQFLPQKVSENPVRKKTRPSENFLEQRNIRKSSPVFSGQNIPKGNSCSISWLSSIA